MRLAVQVWKYVEADKIEPGLYVHKTVVGSGADPGHDEGESWTLSHQCGFAVASFKSRDDAEEAAHRMVRLAEKPNHWTGMSYYEIQTYLLNHPNMGKEILAGLARA